MLLFRADRDEVLALGTRILVLSEGRIVHEKPAEQAEPAVLGRWIAGHGAHAEGPNRA